MRLRQRQNWLDKLIGTQPSLRVCRSSRCGSDQPDDLDQIVRPEQGSASSYGDERIRRNDVGPLRRDRLEMAKVILEVDPLVAPRLAAREKNESAAMQRVKRVGDLNPPLIVAITGS